MAASRTGILLGRSSTGDDGDEAEWAGRFSEGQVIDILRNGERRNFGDLKVGRSFECMADGFGEIPDEWPRIESSRFLGWTAKKTHTFFRTHFSDCEFHNVIGGPITFVDCWFERVVFSGTCNVTSYHSPVGVDVSENLCGLSSSIDFFKAEFVNGPTLAQVDHTANGRLDQSAPDWASILTKGRGTLAGRRGIPKALTVFIMHVSVRNPKTMYLIICMYLIFIHNVIVVLICL